MHWLHIAAAGLALGYLGTQLALALTTRRRWNSVLTTWRALPIPTTYAGMTAFLTADLCVAMCAHRCTRANAARALDAIDAVRLAEAATKAS